MSGFAKIQGTLGRWLDRYHHMYCTEVCILSLERENLKLHVPLLERDHCGQNNPSLISTAKLPEVYSHPLLYQLHFNDSSEGCFLTAPFDHSLITLSEIWELIILMMQMNSFPVCADFFFQKQYLTLS